MVLQTGDTLGHYCILVGAGQRGMLSVYDALDTLSGRVVTIKVVQTDLTPNPTFRAQLLYSASRIAQFAHRGLVREFDYGEQEGMAYMVYGKRAAATSPDRRR